MEISEQISRLASLLQEGHLTEEQHAGAVTQVIAATPAANPVDLDRVKIAVAFVVTGFAAMISFIGLKGDELTAVIRNQEFYVGMLGLFIFLAVATAILSMFTQQLFTTHHVRRGDQLCILMLLLAVGAFIVRETPIPPVTTQPQLNAALLLTYVFLGIGVICFLLRWRVRAFTRPVNPEQLFAFGIVVSLALTSLAVFMGLRIEARSQVSTGAEVRASLMVASQATKPPGDDLLKVDVSSSKLPVQDYVSVTVNGLPRTVSLARICRGIEVAPGTASCQEDPCGTFPADHNCRDIAVWIDPPSADGVVNGETQVPLSPSDFQEVHIDDYVCDRARITSRCNFHLAPHAHVEIAVPPS